MTHVREKCCSLRPRNRRPVLFFAIVLVIVLSYGAGDTRLSNGGAFGVKPFHLSLLAPLSRLFACFAGHLRYFAVLGGPAG